MQLLSYIKSFCQQFDEGDFYRRNFKFFKEPKFSGLPDMNNENDYPFREFEIKEVVYRSPLVGYCVEEAFSNMGLWNGFGGGNVNEVHIGYFEKSPHSRNPLITVFEDENFWYFRVANAGCYAPDPEKHVLFYRGTASVVKISLDKLKHYYQIDYKDKVSTFRKNVYYAGGYIKTKAAYIKGVSNYPRVFEVVPPHLIFTVFDQDGVLEEKYLEKYLALPPENNNVEKLKFRLEDLDQVNAARCRHCGEVYIKKWFDVGTCSVSCQFDPNPSKKILPSGYRKSEEDFILKRYPYLDKMGIEITKTWFTEDYYLEPAMARYYMSEMDRWQYFTNDHAKSHALVLYNGFKKKEECIVDKPARKIVFFKRKHPKVSFITEEIERLENIKAAQKEKKRRKALFVKSFLSYMPEYKEMVLQKKINTVQERLKSISFKLDRNFVETLQVEYELQNFVSRPRSLKTLVETLDLEAFVLQKGLKKNMQLIAHSSMTYEQVNERILSLFGPLDTYEVNGKVFKNKIKHKQKNINFNSMNNLMKHRSFNIYISPTSFVVMLSDYKSSKLSYELLKPLLVDGYENRNNFKYDFKLVPKPPLKLEFYKTTNPGLQLINLTKLKECESTKTIYSTYIDYLNLEKEEDLWKWPLKLIESEEVKSIKKKLKDEGWSENSIIKQLKKLKLG